MAGALSGTVEVQIHTTLVNSRDLGDDTYKLDLTKRYTWTNGSGAGKVNKEFDDERTLAASATETLDLSGSAIQDAQGVNLAFAKIKALIIIADPGNTNDVVVGNGTNPVVGGPFGADGTNTISLAPRDAMVFMSQSANGFMAVTNSTADGLKIANSGGTTGVTYRLIIVGE